MRASRRRAMAPIPWVRRASALWAGVLLLAIAIAALAMGMASEGRHVALNEVAPWLVGALLGAALAIGYVACGAILARWRKREDDS
jgi:hypothetical protein